MSQIERRNSEKDQIEQERERDPLGLAEHPAPTRRHRPARLVIDLETGERVTPASVTPEYEAMRPGDNPLAAFEASLRRAQDTAAHAAAGERRSDEAIESCMARRGQLAEKWAQAETDAERTEIEQLARENGIKLRDAEAAKADFAERHVQADKVVGKAGADLTEARRRYGPQSVLRIMAEELPGIEAQKVKAVREVEALHEMQTRFSKRCRPFKASIVEWTAHYERTHHRDRADEDILRMTTVPRPPISGFELNGLQAFDPRSAAMQLLLADRAKREAEAAAKADKSPAKK